MVELRIGPRGPRAELVADAVALAQAHHRRILVRATPPRAAWWGAACAAGAVVPYDAPEEIDRQYRACVRRCLDAIPNDIPVTVVIAPHRRDGLNRLSRFIGRRASQA